MRSPHMTHHHIALRLCAHCGRRFVGTIYGNVQYCMRPECQDAKADLEATDDETEREQFEGAIAGIEF
jgi:hypothetical protein